MSDGTLRTFVALLLPDGVRTGLAAVSEELRAQTRGLTWVPPENLHLTLRFLGEIGPATLEHVRDAVAAAAAAVAPFTVSLGGLGRLSRRGARRGCCGPASRPAARRSRRSSPRSRRRWSPAGIPGESRAFHPHVTLARARDPRGASELARVLGAGPAFGEVRVEALHLMRSELGPRGARYSAWTAAPLGGPLGQG